MDWHLLWKAAVIVFSGTILLRLAGRKSISQMTISQTVIMVGIGSLLIQPIAGEDIWDTLLVGFIFVLTLILMEYIQVKRNIFEKALSGKGKVLIKQGVLQEDNLKKCRLTVDQLEMNLRLQGVERIEDVEWAILEVSGRVAILLKEENKPVTKKEFNELINSLEQLMGRQIRKETENKQAQAEQKESIFTEVERKRHKKKPPEFLQ